MPSSNYDISVDQGSTLRLFVEYQTIGSTGIDLNSYSASMLVRRTYNDTDILLFMTGTTLAGAVTGGGSTGEFVLGSGVSGTGGVLLNSPGSTADGLLVATNQASAWTLGANWILNPNMRLVANYIRTNYDTDVVVRVNGKNDSIDHEDAVTMRAQFDF